MSLSQFFTFSEYCWIRATKLSKNLFPWYLSHWTFLIFEKKLALSYLMGKFCSWPLNYIGLYCTGPLNHRFFSILYTIVLHNPKLVNRWVQNHRCGGPTVESYSDFPLCEGSLSLTPHIVHGSAVHGSFQFLWRNLNNGNFTCSLKAWKCFICQVIGA